jgi:hypothetical protein
MATADDKASTKRAGWLGRTWDNWLQISGFLAIIALIDLTYSDRY